MSDAIYGDCDGDGSDCPTDVLITGGDADHGQKPPLMSVCNKAYDGWCMAERGFRFR